MKRLLLALAASAALVFALGSPHAMARAGVGIINYVDVVPVTGSGKPATQEQLKQAILAAANAKGWIVSQPGDGSMIATLHQGRGKHSIMVDISYTSASYSIKYRDSINMNYNGEEIHPSYNKWVAWLNDSIRFELARL